MSRDKAPHGSHAIAEAVEAIRLQIDDLNQRIERQQKRVQSKQVTAAVARGRRTEPGPAAEPQAVLADMIKQRDALQSELQELEAQQSSRMD
jgi:hypothetical protein